VEEEGVTVALTGRRMRKDSQPAVRQSKLSCKESASDLLELTHLRTLLLTRVFESATHTSTDPLAPNHIAQIIPTLRHFLHHD
jgi:predicted metal-dependent phosphotriesterase family hydrolase